MLSGGKIIKLVQVAGKDMKLVPRPGKHVTGAERRKHETGAVGGNMKLMW